MSKFNKMSTDTLRHTREYGWIYLKDEELYQFIQELCPTFSIERLDELHTKLHEGLARLDSDQTLVFNALADSTQYEIYAEGTDVTIASPDELDLPYPYQQLIPGVYSLVLDNVNDVIALLEIDNILKFKPTNRNTFAHMSEEGIKGLEFNQELYKKKFSKLSLNKVYEYAMKINKHKGSNKDINTIRYDMTDDKIILISHTTTSRKGTRKDYEDLCLSISQLV